MDLVLAHRARVACQPLGIGQHAALGLRDGRCVEVLQKGAEERRIPTLLLTESLPVLVYSVVALVEHRHDDGNHLALHSRQR